MRFLILLILVVPVVASAQGVTLINIPQLESDGFDGYINAVYAVFISLAALLAVIKLIIAGVKYMFSDVVTQKSDAKNDIRGALIGLLIVLSAVLILSIINPDLTNFDLSLQRTQVVERPELDRLSRAIQQRDVEVIDSLPCSCSKTRGNGTCASGLDCGATASRCNGEAIVGDSSVACIVPVAETATCPVRSNNTPACDRAVCPAGTTKVSGTTSGGEARCISGSVWD